MDEINASRVLSIKMGLYSQRLLCSLLTSSVALIPERLAHPVSIVLNDIDGVAALYKMTCSLQFRIR